MIQEIPEIDFIESESKTGVSVITVNIKENYKNMRPIWDKLRRKIDRVEPELPEGTRTPVVNYEFVDVFGSIIGLNRTVDADTAEGQAVWIRYIVSWTRGNHLRAATSSLSVACLVLAAAA